MLLTSGMVTRALESLPDDFISVKIGEKEYVIESIGHTKTYGIEDVSSHLCLNARDAGEGCIHR